MTLSACDFSHQVALYKFAVAVTIMHVMRVFR